MLGMPEAAIGYATPTGESSSLAPAKQPPPNTTNSTCVLTLMAIAISANDEHQASGNLSPTDIKVSHIEGGGPSSVQMGQENVIALLLQQQEEVLREIRDQKKGLVLSHENKQEIARLVLSSLQKQRLRKQPPTADPPHHPPLGPPTARKTQTASKRTGKKHAALLRRRRNSRASRDEDRAKKRRPRPVTQESGPYEYSSSTDSNNGTSTSPSATVEPASASAATVIRQRVEERAEPAEEAGLTPAKSSWDSRLGWTSNISEGESTGHGDVMTADDGDDSEGGDDDGLKKPELTGILAQEGTIDDVGNRRAESATMHADISRDTASMLQRSRALVARAKACCGQAARSSTADHRQRDTSDDVRLPPHGRNIDNCSSVTNRYHGGDVETAAGGRSDADGLAGEAGGILFAPSPSPPGRASISASWPLGNVAEEEGEVRISPPATAGAERGGAPEGQALETEALAENQTETCEKGTGPAAQYPTIGGGAGEDERGDPERERRHASEAAVSTHAVAADDARATGDEGAEARKDRVGSRASSISSVGGGRGRRRCVSDSGSGSSRKARKKRGEEPSRGDGGSKEESSAKIDTEWENEIAKNILSLYQTKLKADLDVKKNAKEDEQMRKQQGYAYLTIEEEEDRLLEQQQQQLQQQHQLVQRSNRAATATPGRARLPGKGDARDGAKPSTVAAAPACGKPDGLDLHTARETTTPKRTRVTGRKAATTPSPSSRRPATVATKPREVVVGRDLSLGRAPRSPRRAATGTSGAADKARADNAGATGSKGRGGFRGSKAITVPTRGGGEAVVMVPKRPRPIWFAGSGAIQAEWSALPGGVRVARDLEGLEEQGRGKSSAALDYVQRAMKTHARMRDWGHVTKCHLHSSVILSKLNRHDEALRCLGQVLAMVEEGNLDVGGNSPQKLCLVAICYHNMAVEQLILRHAGEACMSSQNARRLARLCLSYSNRWLHSFEGTHKLALAELARSLPSGAGGAIGESGERGGDSESKEEQRDILKRSSPASADEEDPDDEVTGRTLWDCTQVLWDLVADPDPHNAFTVRGKHVIELGGGTARSPAPEALLAADTATQDACPGFDVIVLSEVLYWPALDLLQEDTREPLRRTLLGLSKPGTKAILIYKEREVLYWPALDLLQEDTREPLRRTLLGLSKPGTKAILIYKERWPHREKEFLASCERSFEVMSIPARQLPLPASTTEDAGTSAIRAVLMTRSSSPVN
eukprot:g1969.t1